MEDDIEGVSVGGMDVSDIEDENEYEPLPMPTRGPSQASSGSQFSQNSQLQPRPPPRHQPRPPNKQGQYAQPLVSHCLDIKFTTLESIKLDLVIRI